MIFFFLVSSLVDIDLNLTSAVSELAEIPGAGREVDLRIECVCVWGGFHFQMFWSHCLCRLSRPAPHSLCSEELDFPVFGGRLSGEKWEGRASTAL